MNSEHANSGFSIKLSEYKKAKLELWRDINPNNMDTLLRCFDIEDYSEFLKRLETNNISVAASIKLDRYYLFCDLIAKLLQLDVDNKKHQILIDQYFYLVLFALDHRLSKEQISVLISISRRTHELACESSFGNLEETFDFFKNLLLKYAVHRPPFSICFFSPKQIEIILDYFMDTYFSQFKFYKYVFTPAVRLDMRFEYKNAYVQEMRALEQAHAEQLERELLDTAVESVINEEDEEDGERQLMESRLTDNPALEKAAQELKEFVRKYLSQRMDMVKKDILVEYGIENSAGGGGDKAGRIKSPVRKTSSRPDGKSPSGGGNKKK